MKNVFTSLIISLLVFDVFAQDAKIMDSPNGTVISNAGGTDIPYSSSILDVRSTNKAVLLPRMTTTNRDAIASPIAGMLVYNNTTNQFNYHDGTAWQQATFGNQWGVSGSNYYYSGGRVGVGTSTPNYHFEVIGDSRISGKLAINDPTPDYNLDVNGNAGIENLGVGVPPDPAYLLKAGGTAYLANLLVPGTTTISGITNLNSTTNVNAPLNANGNLAVVGTATVNNGQGVAYNGNSGTNLRIYQFTTATFNAALSGFGLSAEGAIAFNGGFTGVPRVFVGDIDLTGGASGELYRVQLQLYGCSTTTGTTTCKARLLNTSPNPVNYSITWNCIAIGN